MSGKYAQTDYTPKVDRTRTTIGKKDAPMGKKRLQDKVYQQMLRFPGKSNDEIAQELGIFPSTVKNCRKRISQGIDYVLAAHMAEAFIQDYQMSIDALKLQLSDLEEEKKMVRNDIETGWKDDELPLNTMDKAVLRRDILSIERQKTDIWMKIVTMARQSEAVEVMNLIKKKVIKLPQADHMALTKLQDREHDVK